MTISIITARNINPPTGIDTSPGTAVGGAPLGGIGKPIASYWPTVNTGTSSGTSTGNPNPFGGSTGGPSKGITTPTSSGSTTPGGGTIASLSQTDYIIIAAVIIVFIVIIVKKRS